LLLLSRKYLLRRSFLAPVALVVLTRPTEDPLQALPL